MLKTLDDNQIVSTRRVAMKSFALKAGIVTTLLVGAAVAAATPASASDRHSQTDTDTGRGSDAPSQTDND